MDSKMNDFVHIMDYLQKNETYQDSLKIPCKN